jgi:hypothetical protein
MNPDDQIQSGLPGAQPLICDVRARDKSEADPDFEFLLEFEHRRKLISKYRQTHGVV